MKKKKLLKRKLKKKFLYRFFRKKHFISNFFFNQFKTWDIFAKVKRISGKLDSIMVKLRGYPTLYAHYTKHRFFYRNLRSSFNNNLPSLFLLVLTVVLIFVVNFFKVFYCIRLFCLYFSFILMDLQFFLFYFIVSTARILAIFVHWFVILLGKLFMFQLVPEAIILLAIIIILFIKSWANNYYNSAFFNSFLQHTLNFNKIFNKRISIKLINASLLELKNHYILLISYYIVLISILISFLWLTFQSVDFVRVQLVDSSVSFVNSNETVGMNDVFFGNHFYYDNLTLIARLCLLLIGFFYFIILKNEILVDKKLQKIEVIILATLGLFLSLLMVSASSFLSLFLIIEGVVMVMYILSVSGSLSSVYPITKIIRYRAVEGSLKYLVTNAVTGSFFLLGVLLIVLCNNGDIYFETLSLTLKVNNDFYNCLGVLIGLIFISITFLFKIGAVPFHVWMADLYESATPGILAFFLLIPKLAAFFALLNLYRFLFIHFSLTFFLFFLCVGIISLVVGAISASNQTKINRVLAYSSISQAGSVLILFSILNIIDNEHISHFIIVLFIFSYSLVMLYFTSIYSSIRQSSLANSINSLKALSFFRTISTLAQMVFTLFIFSLSGIPPFLGWFLKSALLFAFILVGFTLFSFVSEFSFGLPLVFKNISQPEMLLLSIVNLNIETLLFYCFLVFTVVIFFALLVSIHYSIQLYKATFVDFDNLTNNNLVSTLVSVSVSSSLVMFFSLVINVIGCFFLFLVSTLVLV